MRRVIFAGVAICGLLFASGADLQAQGSLDLSSSMSAYCVGGSCQQVQFTLDVAGSVFADVVRLFSSDATLWRFGSLLSVYDASMTDVTSLFSSFVSTPGQLVLSASSNAMLFAEPLHLLVQMATWSTPANLFNGSLTYSANGELALPYNGTDFYSTRGTVTPEPSTFVLLATGLFGLFALARRRKATDGGVRLEA